MTENDKIKSLTVSIFTLGCKVNQYDSDSMLAVLREGGFDVKEGLGFADIYIINTCAVTLEAERKSRQTVTRIMKINPEAEIYVCGCASQNNFSQFERDRVVFVSGTQGKNALARELAKRYSGTRDDYFDKNNTSDFSISNEYEDCATAVSPRTRHYIKVQDGCNNFCSYCIVPYLRGRSRSRSVDSILAEMKTAVETAKEVVITGINLSAYGLDLGINLADLLNALSDFDVRIRLGSLEVNVIDEKFLEATKRLKKFCPHFHLSLQSGDDGVLKTMNRRYTTAEYLEAVKRIREYYPDAAITTDIIVGFPTETDEAFCNSVNFAKTVGFSDVHVFPYSSRQGTVAAKLKQQPPEVLTERARAMAEVKNSLIKDYLTSQLGKPTEVLFETKEEGMWCGHTPHYIKVYCEEGKRNTLKLLIPTSLFRDGVK